MAKRKPTAPAPAPAVEPIETNDAILTELRRIRLLLSVIACATTRTALTGDVGAADPDGLIEVLRASAPIVKIAARPQHPGEAPK